MKLLEHHYQKFLPDITTNLGDLKDENLFYYFGVVSNDYLFVLKKRKAKNFFQAIRNAAAAFQEGQVEIISEGQNKDDYICRHCGNLHHGKCSLAENSC